LLCAAIALALPTPETQTPPNPAQIPNEPYTPTPKPNPTPAKVWLTLNNLLVEPRCRAKVELDEYRRDALFRLKRFLNEARASSSFQPRGGGPPPPALACMLSLSLRSVPSAHAACGLPLTS
jgi:hypothetical protein